MVAKRENGTQAVAVLFSAGLDSAVLLADAAATGPAVPIYVIAGLAWETAEQRAIERCSRIRPTRPTCCLSSRFTWTCGTSIRSTHWAIRGEAPGFDTPDEDVYLDGRNIVLLSKTAVFMCPRRTEPRAHRSARLQPVSRCDARSSSARSRPR